MRIVEYQQFLPISPEEAWVFFSNPANLSKITPPAMNFVIRSRVPENIYPGLIIVYRVSPLAGIPMTWVTEITQVDAPRYFVDEQRSGPYAMWHHEHHFAPVEGGVMMTDKLAYKVPLGALGRMADTLFVRRKVKSIFLYRERILEKLFSNDRPRP
jgi:ligand-binding SRPBCC domain-containing protein